MWATYKGLLLSIDLTYYVRVRAYDGYAWSNWTSETFKILGQPKFELSNQTIVSKEAMPSGMVCISVDVTNVKEESGSYPVVLTIDGVATDTEVVVLNPGESNA